MEAQGLEVGPCREEPMLCTLTARERRRLQGASSSVPLPGSSPRPPHTFLIIILSISQESAFKSSKCFTYIILQASLQQCSAVSQDWAHGSGSRLKT